MKRFVFALVFLCLFVVPTSARAQQIKIDKEHHIENVGNGYCGHCCIETIGRYYGYDVVKGHTADRHQRWGDWGGAMYDLDISQTVQSYKMAYYYIPRGSYAYDWLNYACSHKYPCILIIKGSKSNVTHAIVLTGFYEDRIHYFDCNDPGKDLTMTRTRFAEVWLGSAHIIYNWKTK